MKSSILLLVAVAFFAIASAWVSLFFHCMVIQSFHCEWNCPTKGNFFEETNSWIFVWFWMKSLRNRTYAVVAAKKVATKKNTATDFILKSSKLNQCNENLRFSLLYINGVLPHLRMFQNIFKWIWNNRKMQSFARTKPVDELTWKYSENDNFGANSIICCIELLDVLKHMW